MPDAKAADVSATPVLPSTVAMAVPASFSTNRPVSGSTINCCEMVMTSAVMVQITTVSISGSSRDTNPSVIGSLVRTAEWAMAAEPTPASFENAARLNPWISAPTRPPATPKPLNAPSKIWPKAQPTLS